MLMGITCSSARYSVGVKRPGRSAATFTRLSALYVSNVKYVRARSKLRDACISPDACCGKPSSQAETAHDTREGECCLIQTISMHGMQRDPGTDLDTSYVFGQGLSQSQFITGN